MHVFFTFLSLPLTMICCRWQVLSHWRLAGLHQSIQMVSSMAMSSAEMVKSSMSAQRRATTTLHFHQMWNTVILSGPTTAKGQQAARQPLQRLTHQPHLASVCQHWHLWDRTRYTELLYLFWLTSHLYFNQFHAVGCLLYQLKVQWNSPARPNGDIVSYTVHQKDPVQLSITSTVITPDKNHFSDRQITLRGLAAYHRSVITAFYYLSAVNKQKCWGNNRRFDMYRKTQVFCSYSFL